MKKFLSLVIIASMLLSVSFTALASESAPSEVILPLVHKTEAAKASRDAASLQSTADIIIDYVYSDNFYSTLAKSSTFDIVVETATTNLYDLRTKMTLSLLDSDGTTVATQTASRYYDSDGDAAGVIYTLKMSSAADEYEEYSVKFTYSGSYEISYSEEAYLYPSPYPVIKNIKVLNSDNSTFKIELENAVANTTYSLCYEDYETDECEFWKDCTVDSSGFITVTFNTPFDSEHDPCLYICEEGATDCWDNICNLYLSEVISSGSVYDDMGVSCHDIIGVSDTSLYVYLYEKAYGYALYKEEDVENVDVYLYDVTNKKKVSTTSTTEFVPEYGEIEVELSISETLDADNQYIIVADDGYTIRFCRDFEVTAEPVIPDVYFKVQATDTSYTASTGMPSGIKTFYAYIYPTNISQSEKANIKSTLIDSSGATVATSSYVSGGQYKMTASSAIAEGSYTLRTTYDDIVYTEKMVFSKNTASAWQLANRAYICNSKTYIGAAIKDIYDPSDLTFKIKCSDGSYIDAEYHRTFYHEGDNYYFAVVTSNSSESSVRGSSLEMYDGTTLIAPTYPGNMKINGVFASSNSFIYENSYVENDTHYFFIEGSVSSNSQYNITGFDEASNASKTLSLTYNSSKKALSISKDSINSITTYFPIERENTYTPSKGLFIECDGELLSSIDATNANIALKDEFSFSKEATNLPVAVLNLPSQTYSSYKLATTESALSSASWNSITHGLIYDLSVGTNVVYGQFKTSGGTVSDVYRLSILMDNTTPSFTAYFDESKTYYFTEYYGNKRAKLPLDYEASEVGKIHFELLNESGTRLGYTHEGYMDEGQTSTSLYLYDYSDYNYTDAESIVIWMEDAAGNASEKYTFNIALEYAEYVTLEIDGGSLVFCKQTGAISEVDTTAAVVEIPSKIAGYLVKSIDEYAFENCDNLTDVTIPDSVTSINRWAFTSTYNLTIHAYQNSCAEDYANSRGIDVEYLDGAYISSARRSGSTLPVTVFCTTNAGYTGKILIAHFDKNGFLKNTAIKDPASSVSASFSNAKSGDIVCAMWIEGTKDISPRFLQSATVID